MATTGKVIALIKGLAALNGSAASFTTVSGTTMTASTALIVGTADTNGVRLDLESGTLAVREGDDSGYAGLAVSVLSVTAGGVPSSAAITIGNGTRLFRDTTAEGLGIASSAGAGAVVIQSLSIVSSALTSGASYTFSGALPDGAIILGVSARITTTITGPTSVQIGDGTDPDRYGVFSTLTSGQTLTPASGTASPLEWRSAAGDVVLTAVGGNFTAGVVRILVHYISFTAPTS